MLRAIFQTCHHLLPHGPPYRVLPLHMEIMPRKKRFRQTPALRKARRDPNQRGARATLLFCPSGRLSCLLAVTHYHLLLNQSVLLQRLLRSDAYSHQGIPSSQTSSVVSLVRAKRHRENEGPREAKREVIPSAPREEPVLVVMLIAVVEYF